MEFRFDATLCFDLVNENSDADDIKCLRRSQVPYPCLRRNQSSILFQLDDTADSCKTHTNHCRTLCSS